jgi:hypothetical protein
MATGSGAISFFTQKEKKSNPSSPRNGKKMAAVPTSDFNELLPFLKKIKPFLLESKKKDGRHFHHKFLFFSRFWWLKL